MTFGTIMCFGSSSKGGESTEARRNAEIEKQIKLDEKKNAREVKLLLLGKKNTCTLFPRLRLCTNHANVVNLGAGESGKSTVLKQMRLIHTAGFSQQERRQWKVTIFSNLMHAFQCVQGCMDEHDVDFESKECEVRSIQPSATILHTRVLTIDVIGLLGLCHERSRDRTTRRHADRVQASLQEDVDGQGRTGGHPEGSRVRLARQSFIVSWPHLFKSGVTMLIVRQLPQAHRSSLHEQLPAERPRCSSCPTTDDWN